MRDFLPADVRKRNYVIGIIKEVYESYGFEPLETPAVENIETLTGKYGEEGSQLIFKILKRGEKLRASQESGVGSLEADSSPSPDSGLSTSDSNLSDLALRYDLTVPLARVVANRKNDLPKFFKRYQIQPVWRADRPAKGRFREFYQCDVDAIGSKSLVVEAELISAVSEILTRLGFDDFVIRINHRDVLNGILTQAGIPPAKHDDALIALDKIDKIGREGVEREFRERGLAVESTNKLMAFLEFFLKDKPRRLVDEAGRIRLLDFIKMASRSESITATVRETSGAVVGEDNLSVELDFLDPDTPPEEIERLRKWGEVFVRNAFNLGTVKMFLAGSNETPISRPISDLFRLLERLTLMNIWFDPTLSRGLSYYTGTIMEINVPDLAGSLGGGGRYDRLIGMFGKEQIPACGFSLGLERILVVMDERNMFPPELAANSGDVMVTIWNEESIGESLKLANELRQQGLRIIVYPEADKLGKQFKYASQINVPYVCVLGESEIVEDKVTLKNMQTGDQETIGIKEVAERIATQNE